MNLVEHTFRSRLLENERRVWLQSAAASPTQALCILLDGEYYVERMQAPAVLAELSRSKGVPPFSVVYVSHIDGPTRWQESFCNDRFARFVGEELLPWALNELNEPPMTTILGGLSLTGLAAAHAVLAFSERFSGLLCQSASFWWSDNRIIGDYQKRGRLPVRFRISCGADETTEYVEHAANLIQRTSQLACNRTMRDTLLANDCPVSYEEFEGGHDTESWTGDLPKSLAWLLADSA